jgi:hypothetical protein
VWAEFVYVFTMVFEFVDGFTVCASVADGWVRLDLSRIAGRELSRGQRHLTISGLEPAAHSTTGFLDLVTENSRKVTIVTYKNSPTDVVFFHPNFLDRDVLHINQISCLIWIRLSAFAGFYSV